MRIVVNRTTCAGIGICEGIDPERFEVRADGKTHLLKDDLEDDDALEVAREAVARCPTQSLQIISPDRGLTAPRRRCLRESGN